ncbi:hypothetical protein [Boudabousia marimammalium]|uniref:Uncharacterized protein n=1 Tax=Boudabousia marimammalium TaxID=156892 RepID=A0A1Q5PP53_9ACTO|nr:hypothetical protein [Boudabousia marimammalium]OKL49292.1 hypothetical protein BM477_04735 [Boudabousia marimammalium]
MHTFSPGAILKAEQLNGNFAELEKVAKPIILKRPVTVNYSAGQEDYWDLNLTKAGFTSTPIISVTTHTVGRSHITATPVAVTPNGARIEVKAHRAYTGTLEIFAICYDPSTVIDQ